MREVERSVRAIVGGGISLVAGLWLVTLGSRWSPLWLVGSAMALVAAVGLAWGIWIDLEY